ncbi:MAG: Smr/MutS family protein, partial [Pseudomonadota bacterium]
VPITSELDLHTFQPREISSLVPEYIREARRHGFLEVRIIHGKGIGTLREHVWKVLATSGDHLSPGTRSDKRSTP